MDIRKAVYNVPWPDGLYVWHAWLVINITFFLLITLSACVKPEQRYAYGQNGITSFDGLAREFPSIKSIRGSLGSLTSSSSNPSDLVDELDFLAEVFQLTEAHYITPVVTDKLVLDFIDGLESLEGTGEQNSELGANAVENALKHMLAQLDPHSEYLTPAEYESIQIRTSGEFAGIGIEMVLDGAYVKCRAVMSGTPASRSGIKAGDIIVAVDGVSLVGAPLLEVAKMLRGPPGTSLTLRVGRNAMSEDFELSITRALVNVESIEVRMEGDIGYVRVSAFNEKTHAALRHALTELTTGGDKEIQGLVIDLRNNPGGLLEQALLVTSSFLESGKIVSTVGRLKSEVRSFRADPEDITAGLPLAVLINGSTASASEIVSGALKDRGRAIILGQRSFGKGSVQTIIPLSKDRGALRLTTARYYLPSGESIQAHGVEPHIVNLVINYSPRETDLENFLQAQNRKLIDDAMTLSDVCPGSSVQNDPVLACALLTLQSHRFSSIAAQLTE